MTPTTASRIRTGQTVRIESGPKAGKVGVVANLTRADQIGGEFLQIVIIDFADGTRSARQAGDPVSVAS